MDTKYDLYDEDYGGSRELHHKFVAKLEQIAPCIPPSQCLFYLYKACL
jgi:hypothetical protein